MTSAPSSEPVAHHAGWYADPWQVSPWRWWDGHDWTVHTAQGSGVEHERKPRLPSWLSVPVLIGLVLMVPLVLLIASQEWRAIPLGLVPLLIVLPVLAWLDRVEPEPRGSRIHAMLWGAAVAGIVSGIVNTFTAAVWGDVAAGVVSAPLIEEAMKGLGIYWALRRREVDGVTDGLVYAGWVALGFAVAEDFVYFERAAADGFLVQIFILRALLTPFAHPLFTAWIGLAIGLAVAKRSSVALNALWGYGLAVASHAAWNGSIAYAEETGNDWAVGVAALCFIGLFFAAAITVFVIRRREQKRFVAAVPMLAQRYRIDPREAEVFADWRTMLSTRRGLPRAQRADFDAVHAALARLSLLHEQPGPVDNTTELRLVDQLQRARSVHPAG